MELLKNKQLYLISGFILIIAAVSIYYYTYTSGWKIHVKGLHSLNSQEVVSYVQYYLKENPDKIASEEIREILEYHPRIKEAKVNVNLKNIYITVKEKKSGYLSHNNEYVSEVSAEGQTLQEMVVEKSHLSRDFPIFYLTAENDNEVSTVKRDIIRLWETTRVSHSFLWDRISEIVLKKDELDNPEIELFHSFLPVKITMYSKFDTDAFRKLWAVFYLLESEKYSKISSIRIYQDHGVLE